MGIIRTLFEIIGDILSAIIETGFDCLTALFSKEKKTTLDASFMEDPGKLVSSSNRGFAVNGTKFLSVSNSFKNQITYGGTGSGKTSNILIPGIIQSIGHSSLVINDPSGEIRLATSGAFSEASYNIKILDYPKFEISENYNPLERIKTVADAQKASQLFLLNSLGNKSNDPFWQISATNILSLCFRLLAFHYPKEMRTVQNALLLLETLSYGDKVDKLVVQTRDQALISSYKSFLANDQKLASSILATAKSALGLFQEESVIQVTRTDTLDFPAFRKEKTVLFINNNIANTKYYAPLTGILIQQFFNELMDSLPPSNSLPVFFHIDEASSIFINNLSIIVSNIRKYGCGISLYYQSFHQLSNQYSTSEAKAIEANCWTKVFLPGTPIDVATTLQHELGVFEFVDEKEVRRTRPLMTNSEIKECEDALIFCGHHRAIRLPLQPYYSSRFRKITKILPYQPQPKVIAAMPPLLQFD